MKSRLDGQESNLVVARLKIKNKYCQLYLDFKRRMYYFDKFYY